MVGKMCGRLHSTMRRVLHEGPTPRPLQEKVPAVITARTGKAMRKDATLQIFTKGVAHVGRCRVLVTLAVELTALAKKAG